MRLIDLHVDWLLQYASETTIFDPALYTGSVKHTGQLEGYLQATRAAILACYRDADDWAAQADPWGALGALITRIEAEFPGRLLIGPEDFDRFQDDRDGLAWGMIGIEGFDALIRSSDDLARLNRLFERGVRLFQPLYGATNQLGGSSALGDDRGLTDLGRGFLVVMDGLADSDSGPRPLVDLAHMNSATMGDVLAWYEADHWRTGRSLPIYSHGAPFRSGFEIPRAITLENMTRLRALGGHIGLTPSFFQSPGQIKEAVELIASVPFEGRSGFEGIAIGTDFMGVETILSGLANAANVVAWVQVNFDRATAKDLLHDNALALMGRATGVGRRS
jgi:membrane dipeptidase